MALWKSVTFFLFLLPYYTQIRQTAFFPFPPHPFTRAYVLLQFNLVDTISSCHLAPCTISIWCCDMTLFNPMYNMHLRATDMTTGSIGGVQIHIYLVNGTTDSLCPM